MIKQNRHALPFNPFIKYLGRSITVMTYSKRKITFRPMSIATNPRGQQVLIGPNIEQETVKIPTIDIMTIWQDKTKTRY